MAYAKIAFVNEKDEIIGAGTKDEAWENGNLYRVVRILILNSKGEMLLQKRGDQVAIWPGMWDHAVGGHVDEEEDYLTAAKREAKEELGIENIGLEEVKKYFLDEVDEKGRIKKRFVKLYKAVYDGDVFPYKGELADIKWLSLEEIERWMKEKPRDFTPALFESMEIYKKQTF